MAASEKRTLEIIAKVTDFASRPLVSVSRTIAKFAVDGTRQFATMVRSVVNIRTALAGIAIGFAALKSGSTFSGIIQANAELAKVARGTGAAADRLITLKDALGLAGVEGGRFRGLMAAMTKAIGTALNDGSSKAAKSLGKLGLTLDDLRTTDPVELFDRLAGSLERFATPQEKAAAILEVFPKATGEIELLVDALGKGQAQFRNLVATARFFGGELSSDGVASIERMADAMDLLSLSITGVGRTAAVEIANKFAPAVERIAAFIAANRDTIGKGIANVATVIGKAVVAVTAAVLRLVAFLSANGSKLIESLEDIPFLGQKIADGLRSAFDIPNLPSDAREIRDSMAEVAKAFVDLDRQIQDQQRDVDNALPGEITTERLDAQRRGITELVRLREEAHQRLRDLDDKFQDAGGGRSESDSQISAARAGSFATTISQIASFEDLPAPPTDLAPIIRALFGADGIEGATQKTRSFTDGINDGLARVQERWTDFGAAGAEAVDRVVDGGLNGLTDALADIALGTKSASEAFRAFGAAVLQEVTRMIIRLLVMQAIMALTGFGLAAPVAAAVPAMETGGTTDREVVGTVPLRRFESGGIARGPTLALFGEGRASRGEAFVPLPDGRRIPVMMSGGGGGTNVQITINAMDGADVQRVLHENRETLRSLWSHDAVRFKGMRHVIQGASR